MSKENVELVRRACEAALAADWPATLATLHPDADIHDLDVPDADVGRGHEGFLAWIGRWSDGWESWRVEDLEIRAVGDDRVVALFRMIARGAHSGLELDRRDAIVYRIQDGLIVYMAYYNDQQQALEAAPALGESGSGEQADD